MVNKIVNKIIAELEKKPPRKLLMQSNGKTTAKSNKNKPEHKFKYSGDLISSYERLLLRDIRKIIIPDGIITNKAKRGTITWGISETKPIAAKMLTPQSAMSPYKILVKRLAIYPPY